jgi:hypothetical protein
MHLPIAIGMKTPLTDETIFPSRARRARTDKSFSRVVVCDIPLH